MAKISIEHCLTRAVAEIGTKLHFNVKGNAKNDKTGYYIKTQTHHY